MNDNNTEASPPPSDKAKEARGRFEGRMSKLKGKVAESIIDMLKTVPTEWHKMTEGQQKKTINRVLAMADELVTGLGYAMAGRGFNRSKVLLNSYTVDSEKIKLSLLIPPTDENLIDLAGRIGKESLLIAVDVADWLGADPIKPDVVGELRIPLNASPEQVQDPKPEPAIQPCHGPEDLVCAVCGFGAPKDAEGDPVAHNGVTGEVLEQVARAAEAEASS